MSPAEFRAARTRLGLSHAEMARALGYRDRQSSRRMETAPHRSSHRPVPPRVAALLSLVLALPEKARKAWLAERGV
jgi:hypothetical protein